MYNNKENEQNEKKDLKNRFEIGPNLYQYISIN
jgi:hypothetical protein